MEEFEEPVRILSDLHLAHPGSRVVDAMQLAPLLEGVKTVIFNGDTSEERMKKFRDKAAAQLEMLIAMCDEAGVTMVMLRGNHDPYTPSLGAVDLCGGQVFVTHGDVLYPDVSPWARHVECAHAARLQIEKEYPEDYRGDLETALEVSRRVTQEMEVHQPKAKPGLLGKIQTLLGQAWPPSRPLMILKVWWEAARVAEDVLSRYRPEAKVFVIGHTHRAFVVRRGTRLLVNTGAFLPMSKALAVDIDGGELTVRRVEARAGKFVIGRVVGSEKLLSPVLGPRPDT
ncbi:MAG: putative phosphodiesterase [Verrucomicrobiales bacterium]|jgi:predicted phosphodiesterase